MARNFSADFDSGAQLFLSAMGIRDKQKQQEMMDRLHQMQIQQMEYKMKLGQTPIGQLLKPEIGEVPAPTYDYDEMQSQLGPQGKITQPTGGWSPNITPETTYDMAKEMMGLKELINPKPVPWHPQTREEALEFEKSKLKPIQPKGSDYKSVKDPTSSTGWSYQHISDPAKVIKDAPPPLSTVMTPYQEANLTLREKEGEENRALREQMHNENLAIRKDLLDISKTKANRLPPTAIKDINNKTNTLGRYAELIDSFKDDYAGSVVLGPTMTGLYGRVGAKPERVNWWKDWLFLDNQVRHDIFGATLTVNEQKAWDATTINENTAPNIAKQAMQTRLKISKNALDREVEGYTTAGYDVNIQQSNTPPSKSIHFYVGNDEYFIPPEKESTFLQKYPKAKRVK